MYHKLLGHITFAILEILSYCNKFCRLAIMLMARGNVAWNSCNVLSTGEELLVEGPAVVRHVVVGQGGGEGGEKCLEG